MIELKTETNECVFVEYFFDFILKPFRINLPYGKSLYSMGVK